MLVGGVPPSLYGRTTPYLASYYTPECHSEVKPLSGMLLFIHMSEDLPAAGRSVCDTVVRDLSFHPPSGLSPL